jgi:cyclopropane-fatty-acyl-phospholipid synthase
MAMSATAGHVEPELRSGQPWREVGPPAVKPVHEAIARWVFRRALTKVPVRVEMPDGTTLGAGGPDGPVMRINDDRAFFRRLGADGLIGFGEAFMVGDWDAADPAAVLEPLAARLADLVPAWMQRLRHYYVRHVPAQDENTEAGARRNIARHYDLSNDLFALFLDDSMTYSSALFEAEDDTLERAQVRKIDRLLDATQVRAGSTVMEIGTGWGALAIRAAQRGARVTTLTLSRAQQALARERIAAAGVDDRVVVELRDYRAAHGQYDAVVSVEMIEAVGERYWPTYFATLDRLVAPGGRVGIQAIVLEHDRMVATRNQYTWIAKWIFPGGALPSIRAIRDNVAEHTHLQLRERFAFGTSYARTLRAWRERFDARQTEVGALGFDRSFRRMWDFYLAYCEAGFATGYLDVEQLVLAKDRAP